MPPPLDQRDIDAINGVDSGACARTPAPALARERPSTRVPTPSYVRDNTDALTQRGLLQTLYREVMELRDWTLRQEHGQAPPETSERERELLMRIARMRGELSLAHRETRDAQRELDRLRSAGQGRTAVYVVRSFTTNDPYHVGTDTSTRALLEELQSRPMDEPVALSYHDLRRYLLEILRLRTFENVPLAGYVSYHVTLREAMEQVSDDFALELEVWKLHAPSMGTALRFGTPSLIAKRTVPPATPRSGPAMPQWEIFDPHEAAIIARLAGRTEEQPVRDEEEISPCPRSKTPTRCPGGGWTRTATCCR